MADLTKNINVGVDASGVKTGLQEATKSIKDFGKTVQSESSKSKTGIDGLDDSLKGLGPTTEKSTKTSERAFSSWSAQVKRAAVEIQAAGDKVKEFELKAQLKGFSADAYKPQIEALRGVIAEQDRLRASNTNLGMSAAATAAALRNVPAQFTDIVVSLQAGQAPMTVLLQQGGQLKDMFGGVGAAAKALGGYVLSLVNPFSLIAAGVAAIAVAYNQGSKENEAFVKAVTLSGNASGVTATQLREYAREIDNVVGTQAQAAEGLAAFTAAGVRGGDQLRQYTQTAIEWEKATGQAVTETAKQFADLQGDPLTAVVKLNQGMNFLTSSVFEQIKALSDQGRSAEASELAMNSLDSAMRERSKTIKDNLGFIERGWNGIKSAAKEAWDAMLNVGRAATLNDQLGNVRKELNSLLDQQSWGETGGGAATGRVTAETKRKIQERIDALRSEEWQLEANASAERLNAAAKEATAKATQDAIAFSKTYDQYKSKEVQRTQELTKAENEYRARIQDASLTRAERNRIDKEYVEIQKGINEKFAEKGGSGRSKAISDENKEFERQRKLIGELAGLSSTFYKDWDDLSKAFKSGVIKNVQDLEAAQSALLAKQPFMTAAAKAEAEALREKQKALDAEKKAQEAITSARLSAANAVTGNVQKLKDDIAAARMSYSQNISLARALEMVVLARTEDALALEKQKENNETNIFILEEEIKKRKELIGLLGEKEAFDNFKKSAEDATNEARRMMDSIGDALTNALMDGGKSAAEYIKGLLRSLFIRPFVMNIVANVLGMPTGVAGSAIQAAGGGGGGMLGLASNANTVYNLFTGGMAGMLGGMATSIGTMIGSTAVTQFGMGLSGMYLAPGLVGPGVSTAAGAAGAGLGGMLSAIPGWGWALAGIGALFGGDIISGLFGRKLKESGVEGEFGGDTGFEGRLFKYYKGGLFRSNKTTYEDMPEEMRKGLGDQFLAMDKSIREMGDAVGLGGSALDGFTAKIKVNLKGLSEEEATKKLQEEFQKIADQMGALVLTSEEYTQAGETQLEALTRLSTSITLANEWFKAVGDTLYTVGLAGADMASDLMDAFGGADKFAAATSNYYDKFFTDQEKVANQTRLLDEQLKKLGVETMPASREAFRDYINSIDVTTEAGQKLYASLLQMADVFDLIYSSAENIAGLKEDLNVQLMRAKGDEEGATRLEREKQLRELEKYKDPELVRLQVEVWAAEDKSKKDAEAKQAADDMAEKLAAAQKAAQDLALKNLEAAISREKEYWNQFSANAKDALSKASSYWTLVTDAAKNLRGSTDDISSWNAAQGMVFIEQAVANARKGLGLSDYDATKSAIDSATSGLSIDKYATQAELDYDKKVLAGQLDELGDFAGLAKSDAQKQIDLATDQIKRLDDTLKFWQDYGKEQVNATLSVTEAVNALYKLLDPKEQERIRKEEAEKAGLTGGSTPPTSTGGGTLGGTVTGSSSGTSIYGYDKDGRALYSDGSIGARPGEYDKSGVSKNASLSEEQWERLKSGQSVYDGYWLGGKQYGLESYYWDEQKQAWLKKGSFAVGTNYVPYDMTANIHQGERIIPAADNRALMAALNTQGGGNAELIAAVKKLEDRLASIDHNTADTAISNRRLDANIEQVSEGGNGLRTVAMN